MTYKEYGQDPERFKWSNYIPIAVGAAAIGGYALASKHFSRNLINEIITNPNLEHSLDNQLNKLFPSNSNIRNALRKPLEEALNKPFSMRESFTTAAGNSWAMKAIQAAGKYVYPVGILDNIYKMKDIQFAARNKIMALDKNQAGNLVKRIADKAGLKSQEGLMYVRGNIYKVGTTVDKQGIHTPYMTPIKELQDVYPVKGDLASLVNRLNREVKDKKPDTFFKHVKDQLDIDNVSKKYAAEGLKDVYQSWLGLKPAHHGEGSLEFIKASHPLRDIKNALSDLAGGDLKRAITRFSPGRSFSVFGKVIDLPKESLDDISASHLAPYHLFNRLNQAFAGNKYTRFMALSDKSTRSTLDLYLGIGLKRIVPLYMGYEAIKFANYGVGRLTGKDVEERIGDARANMMLDLASIKDSTGLTKIVKRAHAIAPEIVEHAAHPLTEQPVGLSRPELEEYFAHGKEAIRKGRWWAFGSGESIRGGKIDHFAPNWYQRTQGKYKDYAYTDTRWGSKENYWKYGTWMPNPINPIAPITKLLNPYFLENKHYKDRPYAVTGDMFADNIFGIPLNMTIGAIFKPHKKMHQKELSAAMRGVQDINEEIKNRFKEQTLGRYYMYTTGGGRMTPMESLPVPGSPGAYPIGGAASYINQVTKQLPGEDINIPYSVMDSMTDAVRAPQTVAKVTGNVVANTSMMAMNQDMANGTPVGPYSYDSAKQSARRTLEYVNQGIAAQGYRHQYNIKNKLMRSGVLVPAKYPRPEWVSGTEFEQAHQIGVVNNVIADTLHIGQQFEHLGGMYGFGVKAIAGTFGVNIQHPAKLQKAQMGSFSNEFYKNWNVGGLGSDAAEIIRRFIPKVEGEQLNLIPNTMPSWIPYHYGREFHKGDPYLQVAMGEVRLPGAAYEKAHGLNIMKLQMSASSLGKSPQEIVQFLLGMKDGGSTKAAEEGTIAHKYIEHEFEKKGVLYAAEYKIHDNIHNITGIVDAIVRGPNGEKEVVEVKTKANAEVIDKMSAPEQAHIEQIMFYMAQTGIHTGYLHYASREQPSISGPRKVFKVNFDQSVVDYSIRKLEAARSVVRNMVSTGTIAKEELYSPFERFKILADVAPYSKEYEYYKQYLSNTLDKEDEKRKEFAEIKKRASQQKKRVEFQPYRFKYANITKQTALITETLAPGVFKILGNENPIRLAGVQLYGGDDERGEKSKEFEHRYLKPGSLVTLGYAADEKQRVERDSFGSIHAAVWSGRTNVGREAIRSGIGKEKETDYRPAAVHTRFSGSEIMAGRIAESAAHYNVLYLHNKFMAVNSALEDYKRKEIYGKRFTTWSGPISDHLIPALMVHAAEGPIDAALWGGMLGGWMAKMKPTDKVTKTIWQQLKYKKIGAIIGAGIGVAASLVYKAMSAGDKAPIPGGVKHVRALDEYYDKLKYVKFRRLYEATRRVIKKKEGIDIEALARVIETRGERANTTRKRLEAMKRRDKAEGIDTAHINARVREITENRKKMDLTPMDVLAMQFREEYKSTMTGLDVYGSFANMYKALPERERDYISGFIDAPPEERTEILKLVPEDVRKLLRAKWYGEDYKQEPLTKYFSGKNLPNKDWAGWLPWRALDDYKTATMIDDGVDIKAEGYWPSDVARMRELGIRDIQPFKVSGIKGLLQEKLSALYKGIGLEKVVIDISHAPSDREQVHMNINIDQDRESDIKDYVERHSDKIIGS